MGAVSYGASLDCDAEVCKRLALWAAGCLYEPNGYHGGIQVLEGLAGLIEGSGKESFRCSVSLPRVVVEAGVAADLGSQSLGETSRAAW